jgi:hypothetical protein
MLKSGATIFLWKFIGDYFNKINKLCGEGVRGIPVVGIAEVF